MATTAEDRLLEELRRRAQELTPGSRLPSVRQLSRKHRAGPATVTGAMARLASEGLAVSRPGRGTFVTERVTTAEPAADLAWQSVALGSGAIDPGGLEQLLACSRSDAIPLASGFPEEALLPVRMLASAAARAARRPGAWARTAVEGVEELRAWFAREAGRGVNASDVLITPGAQPALATVMRAFARAGDPILVESPTYLGALAAARSVGLIPIPVPADHEGVRTDLLAQTLERSDARLMYLQPVFANPHCACLSAQRRDDVLELADKHGVFVIEDDYVRDIWLEGDAPAPPMISCDPHGHVIYIRSLTKATAASLRIACVIARGPAHERIRQARMVDDFFVSGVLQHTAIELVTSPGWQRHLRQLRRALASRRDTLIAALDTELPDWRLAGRPRGGLGLWLELPHGTDEGQLVRAAAFAGVLILAGAPWFPTEPSGPHVRLSYAGAPEARLVQAVSRLHEVWNEQERLRSAVAPM